MSLTQAANRIWLPLLGAAIGAFTAAPSLSGQAPASVATRTSTAGAQTSVAADKVSLIRRILERTKAADRVLTGIEEAIPAQRAANPQIPKEFWNKLLARARGDAAHLVDMLVRVYETQFTVAELEQLAAFYDSPVGRHLIEAQPIILAQTMQAGQLWGARLSAAVMQEVRRPDDQRSQP